MYAKTLGFHNQRGPHFRCGRHPPATLHEGSSLPLAGRYPRPAIFSKFWGATWFHTGARIRANSRAHHYTIRSCNVSLSRSHGDGWKADAPSRVRDSRQVRHALSIPKGDLRQHGRLLFFFVLCFFLVLLPNVDPAPGGDKSARST